jgi:hypothetical protein
VWSCIIDTRAAAQQAAVQIIDIAIVRIHQHAASKIALRQKPNFTCPINLICPVQSLAQKYFAFVFPKLMIDCPTPHRHKGRIAIVTNAERKAADVY